MIVTETFYIGNREFTKTTSDAGRYVVRDGVSYEEACDPAEYVRTYIEGDIIENEETNMSDKAKAYDILVGGTE